ncbi:AAA family ATPase [Paenibacillus sp. PR3]|uniref:AAA family ATPase n=1 Tax=Paenibacillus terricola TaxID=2763503 RepID=A0ABR8N443_9BACL|nr:AAA family ATPase [Paenibacillus terricola]MBD3922946.1 AAA family ATPase [Paenibacillus terricola]
MYNRIHIFGASGSGATTLGSELTKILPHVNFDGDDYFWKEKFSSPRVPQERVQSLQKDMDSHEQWILSGAICGWGDELKSIFDLVVFLHVPAEIRLQRLRDREFQRYGDSILPGGDKHEQSVAFLDWAALYDTAGLEVRSKALHEQWMLDLTCPILRIEGDQSVEERVEIVMRYIERTKEI